MLETHPMSVQDYIRFKDAAKFWAWYHGKTVKVRRYREPGGLLSGRVTLISHSRNEHQISK